MSISLRQIITLNGSATRSFRDQVTGCRNPAFFAGKDIRSLSAWTGYYYQTGTESGSETQTRYSEWACDVPAVNGRKTRTRYTDTRTRTRPTYSNGTVGEWGVWSEWAQTATATEEAFDGAGCPYRTGSESQSNTKTEYSGWACDVPAVNGRMTRHRYDYIQYRYRDIFSNGTYGEWGSWGEWSLTADNIEEAYNGTSCPYQTGTGSRHNYGAWSYSLPTGLGATGTRTRAHSITTWPIYSNGATGAESTTAQPNDTEYATLYKEVYGSGYRCVGTYKQDIRTYRNRFTFSDTTQYSDLYNMDYGQAQQVAGYCGYNPLSYDIIGEYPHIVVDGPDSGRRAYISVRKTNNGAVTTLTPSLSITDYVPKYNGRNLIVFNGGEITYDPSVIGLWMSDSSASSYYTFTIEISADGRTWQTMGLLEKRAGECPLPWPPSM